MKLDDLHEKLIRAARQQPPSDKVPYAFERRIMANLQALPLPGAVAWFLDGSAITRALWWAAGACTAIAISIGAWTFSSEAAASDFSDELEQTIIASADTLDFEVDFESSW